MLKSEFQLVIQAPPPFSLSYGWSACVERELIYCNSSYLHYHQSTAKLVKILEHLPENVVEGDCVICPLEILHFLSPTRTYFILVFPFSLPFLPLPSLPFFLSFFPDDPFVYIPSRQLYNLNYFIEPQGVVGTNVFIFLSCSLKCVVFMLSWQMCYVVVAIIQVGSLRTRTLHVSLVSARFSGSSKCETLPWPVLKTITVINVWCVSTKYVF